MCVCVFRIVIAFAVAADAVDARKAQYTLPDCVDCKYMHEHIKANCICMSRMLKMVFFAVCYYHKFVFLVCLLA